jgi:hypothetical protein
MKPVETMHYAEHILRTYAHKGMPRQALINARSLAEKAYTATKIADVAQRLHVAIDDLTEAISD